MLSLVFTLTVYILTLSGRVCALRVDSPPSLAGSFLSREGTIGAEVTPDAVTGQLALLDPLNGCSAHTGPSLAGKIAVSMRGVCVFSTKHESAASAGAIGLVVVNSAGSSLATMASSLGERIVPIPGVLVGYEIGNPLIQAVSGGSTAVTVTIARFPVQPREKAILRRFASELMVDTTSANPLFSDRDPRKAWDDGQDPCLGVGWLGVKCNSDGTVSELTLEARVKLHPEGSGVSFVQEIPFPPSVMALTSLRVLKLGSNGIAGPMPALNLTSLEYLRVSVNRITSLPPDMASLPITTLEAAENLIDAIAEDAFDGASMGLLDLSFNRLAGEIPSAILGETRLTSLSLRGNPIDTVPAGIAKLTRLTSLDLGATMIKTLPDDLSSLTRLVSLSVADARLTSFPPPGGLPGVDSLESLDLSGNTGLLSAAGSSLDLRPLTSLRTLSLSRTGANGGECGGGLPSGLLSLDVSGNRCDGLSKELSTHAQLRFVNISANAMSGVWSPDTVNGEVVEELDASGNKFFTTGSLGTFEVKLYTRLRRLSIARNAFEGNLLMSAGTGTLTTLEHIDLSGNPNLNGTLPDSWNLLPKLVSLDLRGTGIKWLTVTKELPTYLTTDWGRINRAANGTMWCPGLTGTQRSISVSADPEYHDYTLCQCAEGHWRKTDLVCEPCPTGTVCDGFERDRIVRVQPGFYPTPNQSNFVTAVRCGTDGVFTTVCNPDGADAFTCADGFDGRLCSRCLDDHFQRGMMCHPCSMGTPLVILVFLVVVAVIAAVFVNLGKGLEDLQGDIEASDAAPKNEQVMLGSRTDASRDNRDNDNRDRRGGNTTTTMTTTTTAARTSSRKSGNKLTLVRYLEPWDKHSDVLGAVIEYLQAVAIILTNLKVPDSLATIGAMYSIFKFDVTSAGIECVTGRLEFSQRVAAVLVAPVIVVLLIALIGAVRSCTVQQRLRPAMWITVRRYILMALDIWYFPMAAYSIGLWACETDPGDGISYFRLYPDSRCDTVSNAVKAIAIIVYPVGIMFLFGGLVSMHRGRGRLDDPRVAGTIGFLYQPYREGFHNAPGFFVTQRILLASFVTLLAPESSVRTVAITVTLTAGLSTTALLRPYTSPGMNTLHTFATSAELVLFSGSQAVSLLPDPLHEGSAVGVLAAVHVVTGLAMLFALGLYVRRKSVYKRKKKVFAGKEEDGALFENGNVENDKDVVDVDGSSKSGRGERSRESRRRGDNNSNNNNNDRRERDKRERGAERSSRRSKDHRGDDYYYDGNDIAVDVESWSASGRRSGEGSYAYDSGFAYEQSWSR